MVNGGYVVHSFTGQRKLEILPTTQIKNKYVTVTDSLKYNESLMAHPS